MSRNWKLYAEDMLTACDKIAQYRADLSRAAFFADSKTYDAVVRNLEIIGEAAKNLPDLIRDQMPDINFQQISAMRNILAHAYFGIDEDILWDVLTQHIPPLRIALDRFLSNG